MRQKLIYYYYLYCTSIVYFIFYIQLKNKKMTKIIIKFFSSYIFFCYLFSWNIWNPSIFRFHKFKWKNTTNEIIIILIIFVLTSHCQKRSSKQDFFLCRYIISSIIFTILSYLSSLLSYHIYYLYYPIISKHYLHYPIISKHYLYYPIISIIFTILLYLLSLLSYQI